MKIGEFPLQVIGCGSVAVAIYHRDPFFYSARFSIFHLCFIVRSAPLFSTLSSTLPLSLHSFIPPTPMHMDKQGDTQCAINRCKMTTRTENATVRMKNDNSSNTEMSKRDANNYKESEGTEKICSRQRKMAHRHKLTTKIPKLLQTWNNVNNTLQS